MGQARFGSLFFGFIWFVFMALTGCAATHDAGPGKKENTEGISKVYPVSADEAWEIGKVVFQWEGRPAVEEHRDQGYMLTSSGMGIVSWGTVMGAWFAPVDEEHTKVTVISKGRVTVNPAGTAQREASFHRRFAQAVEIVKKGQPLPLKAPD